MKRGGEEEVKVGSSFGASEECRGVVRRREEGKVREKEKRERKEGKE